jgi:nitroreductase
VPRAPMAASLWFWAFLPDPVSEEHQRLLVDLAGRAPSQLNSQPWRFVLVLPEPSPHISPLI